MDTEELATTNKALIGLTEGRIVHYILPDGRGKGQHRPAIVVRNWGTNDGNVNLQVFVDGFNDYMETGVNGEWGFVLWKTSVHYSEEPKLGTWHWIEKA